jgi:N-acetylglutamate synthase-like GNAT family acetyltransferase
LISSLPEPKKMNVRVTVRPAEPRDCNTAALVLQRSIREVCGPDYGNENALLEDWCANKTPEQVRAWIADPSLETLVAERDGEVVGVGQLNGSGVLTLCYVRPDMQRSGIGSLLLSSLEKVAADGGLERLTLTSTSTAYAFYQHHGYRVSGAQRSLGAGITYPMEKLLDS